MPNPDADTRALLRLTLTPGLGPILIGRLLETLGSYDAILAASEASLRRIRGIGAERARTVAQGLRASEALADDEVALADRLGIRLLPIHDEAYPPLLKQTPNPPPLLYIRGTLDPAGLDQYPVAMVGSRSCTQYGIEQAERFATAFASHGLTVISGGARGIDTAAHRAALRVNGRTVAVLGCGLATCYPPDNADLFDRIASGGGAVLSELPLDTPPNAENFPARNRIICGLALGVLVVEAGRRSGALITARVAVEEHGRDVFALPARCDSPAAQGSLDLIKSGGAAMVTHPDDVLAALESPARHHHGGTHAARYAATPAEDGTDAEAAAAPAALLAPPEPPAPTTARDAGLTGSQLAILAALDDARSPDDLAKRTGAGPAALRADLTILEIKRRVQRRGSLIVRVN